MSHCILGEWREGKVRPIPGNAPRNRLVSRWISLLWSICDDPFPATRFPQLSIPGARHLRFLRHGGIYLVRWGFQNQNQNQNLTQAREHTASRRSAPSQGQRTRREDRALSHRPQMSSDRLFLDRVGRHQSPSPLHRQPQNNMHSSEPWPKGDISTLPARGHFYFALTQIVFQLDRILHSQYSYRTLR
jgi:hypothetical protein